MKLPDKSEETINLPHEVQDVVVIGAGVKGLATAYKTLLAARELGIDLSVSVLEKENKVGQHMSCSSHNTGMGHSGIYYNPNSQKAILNSRGFDQLKLYSEENDIPLDQCGKTVVGYCERDDELLRRYQFNAIANGRDPQRIRIISGDEVRDREPLLSTNVRNALYLEEPYVFDADGIMEQLKRDIEAMGGQIFTGTRVKKIKEIREEDAYVIKTNHGELKAAFIANQAGARVDEIAKMVKGARGWGIVPVLGAYKEVTSSTRNKVNSAIYQVPKNPGLPFLDPHAMGGEHGIHFGPTAIATLGVRENGAPMLRNLADVLRAHFKQRVSWAFYFRNLIKDPKFVWQEVMSHFSGKRFAERCQRMINPARLEIAGDSLKPYQAGIRGQKVFNSGEMSNDFGLEEILTASGREGVVTDTNPGSPGFTAALANGEVFANKALYSLRLATIERLAKIWGYDYK